MSPRATHGFASLLAAIGLIPALAHAQLHGTLATSDVAVDLRAAAEAPQLLELRAASGPQWVNTVSEKLPTSIERGRARIPVEWRLMRELSSVRPGRVMFVYESPKPHLRLTWVWQARAKFGPLEHRVIIDNLTGGEYRLAPMDSLRLQLRIPAQTPLVHFYVDKGAGEPTANGTHEVSASEGYHWTGWSTTFAHPVPGRPREIIPYEAVFLPRKDGRGWYAGIEFSGRTRLTLRRAGDRLSSVLGLDPQPGPVVTRLAPWGRLETPTVFLGTFARGPDGAGNQLRPWVRAVLGSAHTCGHGVIFAFHGSDTAQPEHRFPLSGLNARTTYRLHFEDGTSPDTTVSGQQLMTSGLRVVLRYSLSSELVFISARQPGRGDPAVRSSEAGRCATTQRPRVSRLRQVAHSR